MSEELEKSKKDTYVKMTMEAGVAPIELRFTQVNDLTTKQPVAFRAEPVVNSVLLGKLEEEQYDSAMTISPVGVDLAKWGIRETVKLVDRLDRAGREFDFVSISCTPSMLVREDIYTYLQGLLSEYSIEHPKKICLEFPNTLLLENQKKVQRILLDIKLLGVSLMMNGCAADNCPIQSIANLPLDYVVMDKSINYMLGDDKKKNVLNALMQYVKSMDVYAIIEEMMDDDEVKRVNVSDFYGYVPSKLYVGDGSHGAERMVVTSTGEELLEL